MSAAVVQSLAGGLVVSCQAPADSPLHDPIVIAAMAEAAVNQGAIGVRIDTPAHIEAVRQRVQLPIIGLWKRQIPGYEVYITPMFEQAQAVAAAGADVIAVDATLRDRPQGTTVAELIQRIHQELGKPVMADVDTLEAALQAAEAGADLVGTTLYGYTPATKHLKPPGFDLLSQMVDRLSVPIVCEGGIASPQMAQEALNRKACCVVVGTAITGIDLLVQSYIAALHSRDA